MKLSESNDLFVDFDAGLIHWIIYFSAVILVLSDLLFNVPQPISNIYSLIYVFSILFAPGMIIQVLLGYGLDSDRFILYSIGLSLSIVSVIYVVLNRVLPVVGVSDPISKQTTAVFSLVVLTLLVYLWPALSKEEPKVKVARLFSSKSVWVGIVLVFVSIISSYLTWSYQNTFTAHVLLILLIAYSVAGIYSEQKTSIIYMSALGLLFHTYLLSNHVWGWDIQLTYFTANRIVETGVWDPTFYDRRNPLLTSVLVPAIIASSTDLGLASIYKIIYPMVYALVPLSVFYYFREAFDNALPGVVAAMLVMYYQRFFRTMQAKQHMGEFFLILLAVSLLVDRTRGKHQKVISLFLIVGLVFSHYGVSIIAIGALTVLVTLWSILTKVRWTSRDSLGSVGISLSLLIIMAFVWYSGTANGFLFKNLVIVPYDSLRIILTSVESSRTGEQVVRSTIGSNSAVKLTYLFIQISIIFCIIIGLAIRTADEFYNESTVDVSTVLAIPFVGILSTAVVVGGAFGVDRVYSIVILFVGGYVAIPFEFAHKRTDIPYMKIVLLALLLTYPMFSTGLLYSATTAEPDSFALDVDQEYPIYTEGQVEGARWMGVFSTEDPIVSQQKGRLLLYSYLHRWGRAIYFPGQDLGYQIPGLEYGYVFNLNPNQEVTDYDKKCSNRIYDGGVVISKAFPREGGDCGEIRV